MIATILQLLEENALQDKIVLLKSGIKKLSLSWFGSVYSALAQVQFQSKAPTSIVGLIPGPGWGVWEATNQCFSPLSLPLSFKKSLEKYLQVRINKTTTNKQKKPRIYSQITKTHPSFSLMTSYLVQMDRSLEGGDGGQSVGFHLLMKSVGVYRYIPLCSTSGTSVLGLNSFWSCSRSYFFENQIIFSSQTPK